MLECEGGTWEAEEEAEEEEGAADTALKTKTPHYKVEKHLKFSIPGDGD